jgi:hypothetical protein
MKKTNSISHFCHFAKWNWRGQCKINTCIFKSACLPWILYTVLNHKVAKTYSFHFLLLAPGRWQYAERKQDVIILTSQNSTFVVNTLTIFYDEFWLWFIEYVSELFFSCFSFYMYSRKGFKPRCNVNLCVTWSSFSIV